MALVKKELETAFTAAETTGHSADAGELEEPGTVGDTASAETGKDRELRTGAVDLIGQVDATSESTGEGIAESTATPVYQ